MMIMWSNNFGQDDYFSSAVVVVRERMLLKQPSSEIFLVPTLLLLVKQLPLRFEIHKTKNYLMPTTNSLVHQPAVPQDQSP